MNLKELGRRLREVRLMRKMTQAEVTNGHITRNMLSQIESGVATPSIKTLEYLCNRLGVSVRDILGDEKLSEISAKPDKTPSNPVFSSLKPIEETEESFKYKDLLAALLTTKKLFKDKKFHECAKVAQPYLTEENPLSDEFFAIGARIFTELAKQEKNADFAKLAKRFAYLGMYANIETKTAACMVLDELNTG
jgi:transcriptional regulator with XRE-family HTH domain